MAKKANDVQYYESVGRRREAVARVRLYITGKDKTATIKNKKIKQGEIVLNGNPIEITYPHPYEKVTYTKPLRLTNNSERFAISIQTRGGGKSSQLDAIKLGLSRALVMVDKEEYKPILKADGLLTRDPRARERRKVGTGGKARRAKQSPKR